MNLKRIYEKFPNVQLEVSATHIVGGTPPNRFHITGDAESLTFLAECLLEAAKGESAPDAQCESGLILKSSKDGITEECGMVISCHKAEPVR